MKHAFYIPGETDFISIHVNNNLIWENHSLKENGQVNIKLDSKTHCVARVARFSSYYQKMFSDILTNNTTETPHELLCHKNKLEINFSDFITECENSFFNLVEKELKQTKYTLKDNVSVMPSFETDFLPKLKENLIPHFLSIKTYLENKEVVPWKTLVGEKIVLEKVINDASLLKLNFDLINELNTNNTNKKTAKI